jgi:hypothetical protein
MKLTETQLKQIIKEEITKALGEAIGMGAVVETPHLRRMSGRAPTAGDENMDAGLEKIWPAIQALGADLPHDEQKGLGIEIYNLIVDRVKRFPPGPPPEIEVWKEELARLKAARQKRTNNLK